jgi:hypothetical protein
MALTKSVIIEKLQSELGFPRDSAGEATESLIEIVKSLAAIISDSTTHTAKKTWRCREYRLNRR